MPHWIMTAGFQNVVEADHIALDISIWVGDGVTNTCLRTKVNHNVRVILLKNVIDENFIRKIAFYECISFELLKLFQTLP